MCLRPPTMSGDPPARGPDELQEEADVCLSVSVSRSLPVFSLIVLCFSGHPTLAPTLRVTSVQLKMKTFSNQTRKVKAIRRSSSSWSSTTFFYIIIISHTSLTHYITISKGYPLTVDGNRWPPRRVLMLSPSY